MMPARQSAVIGKKGMGRVKNAKVCIIGLGSIGSIAAQIMCRSGISMLTIIDRDYVEEGNIGNQLYARGDVGKPKASACMEILSAADGEGIRAMAADINPGTAHLMEGHDLIMDCTDNMGTRRLINDFCIKNRMPWVHSAAIGDECACSAFMPGKPCFSCLYPKKRYDTETCEAAGLLFQSAMAAASMATGLALDMLIGKRIEPRLYRFSSTKMAFEALEIRKNPACRSCVQKDFQAMRQRPAARLCGNAYQLHSSGAFKRLASVKGPASFKGVVHVKRNGYEVSVFSDGRAIIKGARNLGHAKAIFSGLAGE